ncbi:MAG: SDR family NAD(P)-dependent oxidoreductase, partial [Woeseiaceae bacterium]|nr:SDR family NAD(P)-dependent oxidoreductase [Woeseiaceae bacterium]NIP21383.1 SDR family NAD(P)-dependent oxidoreductase [Woeseiaceae bacterium]
YIELAQNIENEFGRLDGLVHNASMLGERYSIEQYEIELWQRVLHVNVTAAVAITQLCLPLLGNARDPS